MDEATVSALNEALQDEYKARATYRKVIDAFGPVRPFINIVGAEGRHAAALLSLYERYGLEPPADNWGDRVETPSSLQAACEAAIEAEIENDAMYERLLRVVSEQDIRRTFENLREASRERHLPAFRRCAERHL